MGVYLKPAIVLEFRDSDDIAAVMTGLGMLADEMRSFLPQAPGTLKPWTQDVLTRAEAITKQLQDLMEAYSKGL